ncbi:MULTISPECIES: bifunctional tetrahydrofolate synthase/dihydrofolate synthase [Shewanella]|uniref:bifunctional tetrahydrofolate synthase/dihydrofolate synthase n=1 Tax=Shewanella TaxID=22 RepID=UPI000C5AA439|nr:MULTISPECIES: bifunctional tetrahydrofolate synthase/dihydrofolate synthase [Shewanella]NCQ44913.1 bifunctional tetrahydrofolate synthase/dihydrofolate synthase [Shewanella frigidimarina]NCO71169.1 bifunctional tetrahydrofolate synthase/dihydrofolate synthase [Shewanella vesiculosa]NCP37545.1 bifunctional tetrahydrofolate synthase/dihydrofolate synthase [Shewanella vesiculosa]NCP70795.1 bifunctional tetrahydrofolate synthase/dihydrofolate synthase [Shewanella vesiculosa]NCP74789.1 bifunctio
MSIASEITVPNQQSSLNQWLDYLLAIHPSEIDMGLTRVSAVARRLEVIDLAPAKVITVAGTNGKGTTCAMLASILRQADLSVGVYSSPHLLHYNERVQINQQDASDASLIEAFCAIEAARGDISLTFFEYATLAGLYLFKAAKVDVIILEVGLGGRLDATNMIDSTATIITSIDLDHQEYLGDTRELVGREKAGVFRPDCLAIVGEPDLPMSVTEYAHQIGTTLYRVGHEFDYHKDQSHSDQWHFTSMQQTYSGLSVPKLPLANAASVVALLSHIWPHISQQQINQGLQQAQLAGRLEQVSEQPLVLLDVAHNPHAARYLAQQLQAYQGRRIVALCGMLKDKDITSVLATLAEQISHWNFVSLDIPRGASAQTLRQALPNDACRDRASEFVDISSAWHAIQTTVKADDVVIVFGSFYTVAGFKLL